MLQGRRVKPSLCPSLEILDEVAADASIRRLLFCGVGCAVQALRALDERSLGLDKGGLFVLGTHCVDNSPTPEASQAFVQALPGVGAERADDVLAYEFSAPPSARIPRAVVTCHCAHVPMCLCALAIHVLMCPCSRGA